MLLTLLISVISPITKYLGKHPDIPLVHSRATKDNLVEKFHKTLASGKAITSQWPVELLSTLFLSTFYTIETIEPTTSMDKMNNNSLKGHNSKKATEHIVSWQSGTVC